MKVSVSVDPGLLRVVDTYVEQHEGADRSKVFDQALAFWTAAEQAAAMEAQFADPDEPQAELESWRAIRRCAATRRLRQSRREQPRRES